MNTNKKPGQPVGAGAGSHIKSVCSSDTTTAIASTQNNVNSEARSARLQYNYDCLILFVVELVHIADDERRTNLLGECSLNLPDEALHDIKSELLQTRPVEQSLKAAA